MDREALANISMQIILAAGDARYAIMQCLDDLATFDFARGDQLLAEAKQFFAQAHQQQTMVIQAQARGEVIELDLLFVHAQDTLMTINSEFNITRKLLVIHRQLEQRITQLEHKALSV